MRRLPEPDPDCTNCDGRGCMGCVLRWYDHECRNDCPFCCETSPTFDLRHLPLREAITEAFNLVRRAIR